MPSNELRVNTAALISAGQELLNTTNQIPAAPQRFVAATGDPLSAAALTLQQEVEAPLIEDLPVTKTEAARSAEKIMRAAQAYEATDTQLGGAIHKHAFNKRPG